MHGMVNAICVSMRNGCIRSQLARQWISTYQQMAAE